MNVYCQIKMNIIAVNEYSYVGQEDVSSRNSQKHRVWPIIMLDKENHADDCETTTIIIKLKQITRIILITTWS